MIKTWEICSKLTIKKPEQPQWYLFDVFIVNFGYNSHRFLIFLLLALKGHMTEAYLEPNQTSMMERFCNYSWRLRAANYFVKKLDLRYLTGLWIYLWFLAISKQQYYEHFNFKKCSWIPGLAQKIRKQNLEAIPQLRI